MSRKIAIGLVFLLALSSCSHTNNDSGDKIVASIYNKHLYQSDLQDVMYDGISPSDSLVRAKAFIDNWIRRQLIIHQASIDIDASELNFSKQVEDYRNSLIVYKYETYIIEKNLDTIVSDLEIDNYKKMNNFPEDMENEAIRYVILNIRKKNLLEKTYNNLYNKAVKDRVFDINN